MGPETIPKPDTTEQAESTELTVEELRAQYLDDPVIADDGTRIYHIATD